MGFSAMIIDEETRIWLVVLERDVNDIVDRLITKRDKCLPSDKYPYRYIARKLEQCLGAIHKAQDKVGNS
jgi:hypothetical protein